MKNKITAWAIMVDNKIEIVVHGEEEIDTCAIFPTKRNAQKCNKKHCYNEAKLAKVEIKIIKQ